MKLGLSANDKLRAHFSSYGEVKYVYVPHLLKKRSTVERPAGTGFIVMFLPQSVDKILQKGPEHMVDNVVVTLERYRPW